MTMGNGDPVDLRGRTITTFVVNEIDSRLATMDVGQGLDLVVEDSRALDRDLEAWAAVTGHALRREAAVDGRRYSVVKGVPAAPGRSLATVISEPGLLELLSPLGFALAAALEGGAVHIYFQGPAVRVLRRGFSPRLRGISRPFSRFAARSLARIGHVHPHEKLQQLRRLDAAFYACGPSLDHFKVPEDQLIFSDVTIAAYLTFMSVMADSDIQIVW